MNKVIERGCIVKCIDNSGKEDLLIEGRLYTVDATSYFGFFIFLETYYTPFRRDRFEVVSSFDGLNEDDY